METQEEIVEIAPEKSDQTPDPEIDTVEMTEVVQEVIAGSVIYGAAIEIFVNQFVFQGKSLAAHSRDLMVFVPDEVTPDELQTLFTKVARKIQKCSHMLALSSASSTAMAGGGSVRKNDIVAAIVENYRRQGAKRPAATVIEKIADSYMKDTNNSITVSQIVRRFWQQRMDALIETRKCLEQISISQSTAMKYLQ